MDTPTPSIDDVAYWKEKFEEQKRPPDATHFFLHHVLPQLQLEKTKEFLGQIDQNQVRCPTIPVSIYNGQGTYPEMYEKAYLRGETISGFCNDRMRFHLGFREAVKTYLENSNWKWFSYLHSGKESTTFYPRVSEIRGIFQAKTLFLIEIVNVSPFTCYLLEQMVRHYLKEYVTNPDILVLSNDKPGPMEIDHKVHYLYISIIPDEAKELLCDLEDLSLVYCDIQAKGSKGRCGRTLLDSAATKFFQQVDGKAIFYGVSHVVNFLADRDPPEQDDELIYAGVEGAHKDFEESRRAVEKEEEEKRQAEINRAVLEERAKNKQQQEENVAKAREEGAAAKRESDLKAKRECYHLSKSDRRMEKVRPVCFQEDCTDLSEGSTRLDGNQVVGACKKHQKFLIDKPKFSTYTISKE